MDFEKAIDNLEKKREELDKTLKTAQELAKLYSAQAGPGDIIFGAAARVFLDAVSPQALKYLDKLGLGPGKASFPMIKK